MKKSRYLMAALCAVIFLCTLSLPAFAYADNGSTIEPATVEITGGLNWEGLNPMTPNGTGSVVDNATDADGKEFFTITTTDESVFYLVIDRQKSGENVYFLNTVTVADLMALADPGTINTTPIVTPEPEPAPNPDVEPEPDSAPEKSGSGNMGTILLALVVIAVGGVAGWYFKIYRPKHEAVDVEDDYPDDSYPEDDMPLWSEDGEE